jgi:hypothetical protein
MSLATCNSAPSAGQESISMNITAASQAYFAALTRSTQRSDQSADTGPDASQASAAGAGSTGAGSTGTTSTGAGSDGSQSNATPLTGMRILSSVQTVLPNGETLGVFRFDLDKDGLGTSGLDDSSAVPSEEDKKEDAAMLQSLRQMASYFQFDPSAADITLGGTAAIDLAGKTG